ncbi:MAG TPA: hypothetical protein PKL03_06530 [Candidatus Omnitrophota bacterium]|nr:hypothetical protein [Candidatus Omnitrophota bacterium]
MDVIDKIAFHWQREKSTYFPIILFIIFLAVLIVANVVSNNFHIAQIQSQSILSEIPLPSSDTVSEGFEVSQFNGPDKVFTLKADRLLYRKGKVKPFGFRFALLRSVELEKAEIVFFKDNKPIANLISDTAQLDPRTKNVIFTGKPVLMTETRRVLSANQIAWNNKDKKLLAKGDCYLGLDNGAKSAKIIVTEPGLTTYEVRDEKI